MGCSLKDVRLQEQTGIPLFFLPPPLLILSVPQPGEGVLCLSAIVSGRQKAFREKQCLSWSFVPAAGGARGSFWRTFQG